MMLIGILAKSGRMIVRTLFIFCCGWMLFSFVLRSQTFAASPAKPNFLILFLDNVGYGDLGCYGNREVKTPNIDRLASEGVRCTDFYIGSPSCSPSRGALLTGRHPERTGLNFQLNAQQNTNGIGLPLSEKILPQYLKPLGYSTAAFGKWNIGFAPGARPTERGFDEFLGHASGNIHYYKHLYAGQNDMRQGVDPVDLSGKYATDIFADAAIDFIHRKQGGPWLVYLPFNAAHFVSRVNVEPGETIEWQVPEKYLALYGSSANERDQTKRFRAVLTAMDDAIGRVLQTLDELDLRENTFVLLISDNGAFMLPGRGLEVQSNGPLREGGVTTYEGGIRVPAIFRWPAKLKANTCREMLSSLDVLPGLVAAAGGQLPENITFDGRDFLPALSGKKRSPHESLYWVWKQGRDTWQAMRNGKWKLVRHSEAKPWELYDLSSDPGEKRNLAEENKRTVGRLSRQFERWHDERNRLHTD